MICLLYHSMEFHNNSVALNNLWYESHKTLIMKMCVEFGASDRLNELTEKYLGKKLKLKVKKDENAPKRAKSAFFFFCEKHRPKLMNKYHKKGEKVNIGEVTKKLGAMWQKAKKKDGEIDAYVAMNKADRERYETEMEAYKNAS